MLGGSITRNTSVLGPGRLDDWMYVLRRLIESRQLRHLMLTVFLSISWYECEPSDGSPKEITYGFPKRACSRLNAVVNFPWSVCFLREPRSTLIA